MALLASYLPTRRAAKIDPLVALRDEQWARANPLHFVSGHAACAAQSCPAHESRDVLSVLPAGEQLLVWGDHAHGHAHEVRDPHAPG